MAGEKEQGIEWSQPFWRDPRFLCYTPLQACWLKDKLIGTKNKNKKPGKRGNPGLGLQMMWLLFILRVNVDAQCGILVGGVWCDSLPSCGSLYPRRSKIGLVILCLLAN